MPPPRFKQIPPHVNKEITQETLRNGTPERILDIIENWRKEEHEKARHDGHTNYETWIIASYMDGNYTGPETPQEVAAIVTTIIRQGNAAGDKGEQPFYESALRDALKEWGQTQIDTSAISPNSIVGDLLAAAIDRIDWWSLAVEKLQEAREQ